MALFQTQRDSHAISPTLSTWSNTVMKFLTIIYITQTFHSLNYITILPTTQAVHLHNPHAQLFYTLHEHN